MNRLDGTPWTLAELRAMTLTDLRALAPEDRETLPCNSCDGRLEAAARVFVCWWCRSTFRAQHARQQAPARHCRTCKCPVTFDDDGNMRRPG